MTAMELILGRPDFLGRRYLLRLALKALFEGLKSPIYSKLTPWNLPEIMTDMTTPASL